MLLGVLVVVIILCVGHATPEVVPHLCGASLHSCKKGGRLRPITVYSTSPDIEMHFQGCFCRVLQGPDSFTGWCRSTCRLQIHLARVQEYSDISPKALDSSPDLTLLTWLGQNYIGTQVLAFVSSSPCLALAFTLPSSSPYPALGPSLLLVLDLL